MSNRIDGDLQIGGRLMPKYLSYPDQSLDSAAVAADAGIAASKLEHQHQPTFAQPNTTATAETRALHVARGAGEIVAFKAGSIAVCSGNATMTADLRKNGTSVLSAVITLDSANTNRVAEAGTVTTATLAAGDLLEVVTTVNAGTGALGTGLFASAVIREDAD